MLIISSLLTALLFGALAIYFSIKEEKTKKQLAEKEKLYKQKLYETLILKEIQDRIGYSLNAEEIVDVITGSLKHLFSYSTASSLVVTEDKLIFKTYIEQGVSRTFLDNVKNSMFASLSALLPNTPTEISEIITGVPVDPTNTLPLSSFFHIPLIVNNKVLGLINISSTQPNLYKEDEMTILYTLTAQASSALSKLRDVLATEKGKLVSMIASLADGVFMLDTKSQVLVMNDSAKKFLKIDKTNPTLFDVLSAMPESYNLIERVEKAHKTYQTIEEKEVKIGENLFQTFITPVFSPQELGDRKIIGISILLHDITLEKNLSQMKEDFTNIMVHELRAPLTAVKDSSELMLNPEKISTDDQKQLLTIINNQTKLLLDQISQVLDAAKMEAGRFTVEKNIDDFEKLISETIRIFQPAASRKEITLGVNIEKLPKFSFDKMHMREVLNNLISNSLKYTNPGGKITISAKISGNHIEVSVSDTGIGIPKEKQAKVFSKFYRVGGNEIGSGLGLYIVKGIVEAHKGSVSLKSEENKGTTITFTLPVFTQQQTSEATYLRVN